MRHITPDRLETIEPLLVQLRTIPGLAERKRGNFTLRSRACLHFHEHGADIYADLRLQGDEFDRRRVSTKTEQARLLRDIRAALEEP
ncbi:MAG TPA: hypothetical protein VL119_11260 [Acidimicrobiia bacterium]|nr:hypothetical protein [Acidimicrobiia bacterium]